MIISVTPLSRRPWGLWLLPLLPGVGLWLSLVGMQHDAKLSVVARWGWTAWLLFCIGGLLWSAATMPITDYDADYLYLFKKTGPEQIPLASFYKLQEGNRGYWHLHYYGQQNRKKKLTIRPLGKGDDSSIHEFIEAIWQHNPQLDIKYDKFRL
jgi:hypothetical protein